MASTSTLHTLVENLQKCESLARDVNQKLRIAREKANAVSGMDRWEIIQLAVELDELMARMSEDLGKIEEMVGNIES